MQLSSEVSSLVRNCCDPSFTAGGLRRGNTPTAPLQCWTTQASLVLQPQGQAVQPDSCPHASLSLPGKKKQCGWIQTCHWEQCAACAIPNYVSTLSGRVLAVPAQSCATTDDGGWTVWTTPSCCRWFNGPGIATRTPRESRIWEFETQTVILNWIILQTLSLHNFHANRKQVLQSCYTLVLCLRQSVTSLHEPTLIQKLARMHHHGLAYEPYWGPCWQRTVQVLTAVSLFQTRAGFHLASPQQKEKRSHLSIFAFEGWTLCCNFEVCS